MKIIPRGNCIFRWIQARNVATSASVYAVSSPGTGRRSLSVVNIDSESKSNAKSFYQIPQDRRIPLLSFIRDLAYIDHFGKHFFLYMYDAFRKYGDVTRITFLNTAFVVISNPDTVEEICRLEGPQPNRKDNLEFSLGAFFAARRELNKPAGLLELEGEEWANLRQTLARRLLRPVEIKNYFDGFCGTAESVVDTVRKQQDSHGVVEDLRDIIAKWTLESFGTFVFGMRIGLLSESPDQSVEKVFESAKGIMKLSLFLSAHKAMPYIMPWKYKKLANGLASFYASGLELVDRVLQDIKKAVNDGKDLDEGSAKSFVAYLMAKDKLSAEEVVTHALDAFGAGLDTTAHSTGWLIYTLSLYPEVQDQLFREIQDCVPGNTPVTHEKLQHMPYLRACMKETARLFPSAPGVPRMFDRDIVAGGYHFPAKTLIICSNYNMGRNEKIFADPMAFRPEKWLRSRDKGVNVPEELPHAFASLPFGYGPRSCVGRRISEAEMQTLVVFLFRAFKLRYLGENQTGETLPVFGPDKPLKIAFEARPSQP